MRIRRVFCVSSCALFAFLSAACSDIEESARVEVRAPSTTTTFDNRVNVKRWYQIAYLRDVDRVNDVAALNAAARRNAEAVERSGKSSQGPTRSGPPATAPAITINAGNCGQLLAEYFPDDLAWAQHVAQRESHCTAGAVNYEGCDTSGRTNSHAMGVFQMCYPLHAPVFAAVGCDQPLDMECNIRAARRLYDGSGRGPWGG